jgi:hypothetical protein
MSDFKLSTVNLVDFEDKVRNISEEVEKYLSFGQNVDDAKITVR